MNEIMKAVTRICPKVPNSRIIEAQHYLSLRIAETLLHSWSG